MERRGKWIDGVLVLTCGCGRRTDRRDPSTHGHGCMQDHHPHGPTNDRRHLDFLDPTRMGRTTEDQEETLELPREPEMCPWVDHYRRTEDRLDPCRHPTNNIRPLRCQEQGTILADSLRRFLHHTWDTVARHRCPLGRRKQHPVLLSTRKDKHHLLDHHQAILDPHPMGNCQLSGRQPCLRLPTQDRRHRDKRHHSFLASNRRDNLLRLRIPQVQFQVRCMGNNGNPCLHPVHKRGLPIHRALVLRHRPLRLWECLSLVHLILDRVQSRWRLITPRSPCLQLWVPPTRQGLERPLQATEEASSRRKRSCLVRMEILWINARAPWAKPLKFRGIAVLQQ
mmetsp:Transcript_8092/g.50046  ORF Transcript_8092/g.50046 Transcript_8092/m.50046 type:complete len:338 (+) Transcript_8092:251-1264(+)